MEERSQVLSPAERGRIGARRRWASHERRVVRLDELDPMVAAAIRALVAAEKEARAKNGKPADESLETSAGLREGTHDADTAA